MAGGGPSCDGTGVEVVACSVVVEDAPDDETNGARKRRGVL